MASFALDKRKPGWWKEAVFYRIYPKSYQDINGDGIGGIWLSSVKSHITLQCTAS